MTDMDNNVHSADIKISVNKVFRFWVLAYIGLLALSIVGHILNYGLGYDNALGFVSMVDFDDELNAPTFFSIGLILQAALVTWLVYLTRPSHRYSWLLLIFAMLFVCFDEYASIHERLIEPMRAIFSPTGFFYYAWIIPYGIIAIVFGIVMLRWFFALPKDTRTGYFTAAAIYLSAVLLIEGLGGWYRSSLPADNIVYACIYTIEESFEMFGLLWFARTTCLYLIEHRKSGQVEIVP